MPRPIGLAEHAMETQVRLRELKRETAPLWTAAMATGDWTLMSRAHELAATLRSAERQAKAIAGMAERVACPDEAEPAPGHGAAA